MQPLEDSKQKELSMISSNSFREERPPGQGTEVAHFCGISGICIVLGLEILLELDRPASLASLSARALSTSALGGSSLRCCCADRGTRGMSGSFSLQSAPS